MISIKNPDQIAKMRTAGALLYEVLQKLREAVKPGMTTAALDVYAEQLIRKNHAIPSFLHYNGYPATLCTSIDDQIVHGIPSESQVLKEGSILSIDCGLVLDGWQADSAFTMGIGEISAEAEALIEVTEECFWKGVRQAVAGNRLGDLGHAVQSWAEGHGYGVIRDLTGHGIGREMHEDPAVYNFGGARTRLEAAYGNDPRGRAYDRCKGDYGMRPSWMTTAGPYRTRGFAASAAHYEHTIAIREDGSAGAPDVSLGFARGRRRNEWKRIPMEAGRVVMSKRAAATAGPLLCVILCKWWTNRMVLLCRRPDCARWNSRNGKASESTCIAQPVTMAGLRGTARQSAAG